MAHIDVEDTVLKWLLAARARNILVNGTRFK